jgi:hypothetical protein
LNADELAEEVGAETGLRMLVTLKPGLPLGPFQQTIRLATNWPEVPELEIPVRGTVVGDILILEPKGRFDRQQHLLNFGEVKRDTGAKATLLVTIKGPHRNAVALTVGDVYPGDVLQVEVGPARRSSRVVTFPVTIEIPRGSRIASHLSLKRKELGRIEIETAHRDVTLLPVYVRFSVEP